MKFAAGFDGKYKYVI